MTEDKDLIKMKSDSNESTPKKEVEVEFPNLPTIYSDSMFTNVNDFGVVLNFGQRVGNANRHRIVSSIGMSWEHAKAMHDLLCKHINKRNEKIGQIKEKGKE